VRRVLAAVGAALMVLLLAGCTSVDGRVYQVQWFNSGSCFKAIRVGRNDTRAECYGDHEKGDRIRFSVDEKAYRQDQ
jgi:hypothetical protein